MSACTATVLRYNTYTVHRYMHTCTVHRYIHIFLVFACKGTMKEEPCCQKQINVETTPSNFCKPPRNPSQKVTFLKIHLPKRPLMCHLVYKEIKKPKRPF